MNKPRNDDAHNQKPTSRQNLLCPFCKRNLIPDFLDKQYYLCVGENRRFRLESWGLSLER